MDEDGTYVNSHQIFALLLKHNLDYRKLTGTIVKSVSTTRLIDKVCKKYGVPLIETPIGFKYICAQLFKHNALMGGEESGGISLREHVHERDGILNGLLLLEMMAIHGKSLKKLVQDLFHEFGEFHFARDDYHLSPEKIADVKKIIAEKNIKNIGGISVARTDTQDGTKASFVDDSWLLMRTSGTEPLLRVYAEASTPARVQ
jgi:phosphomannomutase